MVMLRRDSPCWAPVGVELKDNIPLGENWPRFPVQCLCVMVEEEARAGVRRSEEEFGVTSFRVTVSTGGFSFLSLGRLFCRMGTKTPVPSSCREFKLD